MPEVGTGSVRITPDMTGFGKELTSGIEGNVGRESGRLGGVGKNIVGSVAAGVGAAVVADKVFGFVKGALDAAAEAQKVTAQTEAVVKSTGAAAGVTVEHVGDLSHSLQNLSGVSDEAIQSGANMLLTFTNIKNGVGETNQIFDEATKTALDMSVALGTDASSSAVQLGKALNDPIKGVGALSRVGVTFTDQQKEQIRTLVESGDVMGAQKIILAELSKEFGGSAEAAGNAMTPVERLKMAFGDMQEEVGGKLLPVMEKVATFLSEHANLIPPVAIAIGVVLVAAFVSWAVSAAAAAAATLIAMAPIILIGVAIAAVAVVIIRNWDLIRNGTIIVWEAVKAIVSGVVDAITGFVMNWTVVGLIISHFDKIKSVVQTGVRFVVDMFLSMAEGIVGAAAGAFGWVPGIGGKLKAARDAVADFRDSVNASLGGIRDKVVTISFRSVGSADAAERWTTPGFARGGMVPGPIGAPMLAVVHGGEKVLTPEQQIGTDGGSDGSLPGMDYWDEAGQVQARAFAGTLRQALRAG